MAIVGRFGQIDDSIFTRSALCDASLEVGDWVYLQTGGSDDRVALANPIDQSTLPAVGVIVAKINPNLCTVQWRGRTDAIFSGLVAGRTYFLGLDSKLVSVPPSPSSGSYSFVQALCVATSEQTVDVQPSLDLTKRINDW